MAAAWAGGSLGQIRRSGDRRWMRRARVFVGTWLSGKDEDVVIRQGEVSTSAVTVAARPWRSQYERGVPPTIDYPAQTLPEVFAEAVARYAAQPAIAYFGGTLRYRDLDRLSAQFAHRLL